MNDDKDYDRNKYTHKTTSLCYWAEDMMSAESVTKTMNKKQSETNQQQQQNYGQTK